MLEHNNSSRLGIKGSRDGSSNSLKGQNMFNTSLQMLVQDLSALADRSILHMGNESTALVHGHGFVDLRLGHVHFKRMQDLFKDGLIPSFDTDTEKCKTCMLTKITKKPFQNVKRETKVLELINSDLCDLHATPSLGNKKFPNKRNKITPYELWTIKKPNLNYLRVSGYVENSKAFRFYVIEPNELIAIKSIIESRDAIFDEHRLQTSGLQMDLQKKAEGRWNY
ncbi:zinc finger, CCHC-type containing protein [Tanacetum coccineum]